MTIIMCGEQLLPPAAPSQTSCLASALPAGAQGLSKLRAAAVALQFTGSVDPEAEHLSETHAHTQTGAQTDNTQTGCPGQGTAASNTCTWGICNTSAASHVPSPLGWQTHRPQGS